LENHGFGAAQTAYNHIRSAHAAYTRMMRGRAVIGPSAVQNRCHEQLHADNERKWNAEASDARRFSQIILILSA